MFDSPLEWCSRCKDWIALDQTVEECTKQHRCRDGECPMIARLLAPQRRKDEAVLKRGHPLR